MVLPAPNLDDRHFQDLVDDAKRLVQQRCPEWTDHNVSDPGVTLIEAFAQKTPVIVRRLGGMPEAVEDCGGGLTFSSDDELIAAMRTLQASPALRDELGEKGFRGYRALWSEAPHLDRYLEIIEAERQHG